MTITSVTSASVRSTPLIATPVPGTTRVGSLSSKWHRDEPILLGTAAGPTFSSFDDALSGAASFAEHRGSAYGVAAAGDQTYRAFELLQPVWTKGFFRQDVHHTDELQLDPTYNDSGTPTFQFNAKSVGDYGNDYDARTGTVELDRSGFPLRAVVGSNWAFVDGQLQSVDARSPEPPTPPTRPTHPTHPTPPTTPTTPTHPTNPTSPTGKTLLEDVTEAVRLANASARIIQSVPANDHGDESSKGTRIQAYKTNMEAQKRIENQFGVTKDAGVLSTLRTADASLEDANWQLAKKPSPDGRFNGVDVPGALRDTQHAVDLLTKLLRSQTDSSSTPDGPAGPSGPVDAPSGPVGGPIGPAEGPDSGDGDSQPVDQQDDVDAHGDAPSSGDSA